MNISGDSSTISAQAASSMLVAKKAQDAQKVEGRAALDLIATAGAVQQGQQRGARGDGTGTLVDTVV